MLPDNIRNSPLHLNSYSDEVNYENIAHRYQQVLNGYNKKENLCAKLSFLSLIISILSFIGVLFNLKGVSTFFHPTFSALVIFILLSITFLILSHTYQIKPVYLKDSYGNKINEFWFLYHNLKFYSEKQKEIWIKKYYSKLSVPLDFTFVPSLMSWGKNSLKEIKEIK